MADPLDTPEEGTYSLDDNLTSDIIDQDAEEDSSLLDAALGDVTTGDNYEVPSTPTDEQADNLLDDTTDGVNVEEDPEIEAIKAKVKEMEEEAEKLKELQGEAEKQMISAKTPNYPTPEEKQEMDLRSVHVGNVDYQSTAEELGKHFENCGAINRVTILCDKYTGHPKGFAYVEFADKSSLPKAMELDESLFKGRQIKVTAKRTNTPGISSTNRGRGRGRGRGFRGGYNPYYGGGYMMMPVPPMRGYYRGGRGRAFRGRAKTWYSPY